MALDVVAQLIDDNRLVPPGGTTGQALVKQSDNDGDAIWDDVAGGGGGGSGTVTSVTLTQPAAGLTITNSGVAITTSGTRTFALANDLAALEALSGTNTIYYRSAADTWTAVTIGANLSFSGGTLNTASSYEVPLTFTTGLTRTVNTITVNTSQNISTLSNLTSNGLVTTSGGTGALSVTTLGSGVAAFLSTPSVANFFSALTGETGPWRGLATATSLGAISFARTNADDSVTMLSVSGLLDEIGMSSTSDVGFSTVNAENGLTAGGGGFTVDATGNCTAASFTGPLTGNASTATLASTVTTAAETSDTTCFVAFTNASGAGNQAIKLNTSLTFNASTGALGATSFVGNTSASTITGTTLASNVVSSSLTSLGTIATGVWQGTIIATAYGGTGVDNSTGGTANTFWARPNGATGAATYRAIVAADIPTLNQNTTGSAATLTTTRTIGGSNFNGSADVTSFPSPGAIGGTTPAAGTFTTLVAGSTTSLLLGTAGSAVGNIGFRNATSGTITLAPTTGALGTVTQTMQAVSGTIYCSGGTDVTVADGGTGLSSGTSGGVLYYSGSTTIASSAALTANALVIGGGAGAAPSTTTTGTGNLTALAANANATGGFVTTDGTATLTNKIISLAALPGTDDTYQGFAITGRNAGTTIAQWEAVYLNSSGEWVLADANGSSTYPAQGLAVAAYSSGNAATVLVIGTVRNDSWNWTVGGRIYLSATAGALTQTQPSTSGDKVQYIGFAPTADSIFVNPSSTFLEVA